MSDQNIMFIFPGQGSQYAGMGGDLCAEFPTAQRVYAEANDALGYDIQALSANGPEEELAHLREPLAELNPQFLVLECGFRR